MWICGYSGMNRACVYISFCGMCLLGVGCTRGVPEETLKSNSLGTPHLFVVDATKELGEIALGRQEFVFHLSNHGDADLHILRVETSCGCTKVKLDETTVKPGGEVPLLAILSPTQPETRSARIRLNTDDPLTAIQDLQLSWTAKGPLEVSTEILDFGIVRPDEPAKRSITLTRNLKLGGAHCAIESVQITPRGRLQVTPAETETTANSTTTAELTYEVLLNPTRDGKESGFLRINVMDESKEITQIHVPVLWHVRDIVEVSPNRLFLGANTIGKPVAGALLITSDLGTKLVVGKVVSDESWLMTLTTEQVNEETVRISIQAQIEREDIHNGTIRIPVTSPEMRILEIPVSALGKRVAASQ